MTGGRAVSRSPRLAARTARIKRALKLRAEQRGL